MKEVIGKTNKSGSRLPIKLLINKNDMTSEIGIANEFDKFFYEHWYRVGRKNPNCIENI